MVRYEHIPPICTELEGATLVRGLRMLLSVMGVVPTTRLHVRAPDGQAESDLWAMFER